MTTNTIAEWVGTPELCKRLSVGRNTLYERRKENVLKPGKHYRRNRPGSLGRIIWDIAAVDQALRDYGSQR